MYLLAQREKVVRIPPDRLAEDLDQTVELLAHESFEGKVEGSVVEILKFGAFVRFGPLDGLLHISQIMDDRIDVDDSNQRLLGKDTKRDLRVGDKVRARIVALSI